MKAICFDMDGTIVDFYGVNNWLSELEKFSVTPYVNAEPLYDMTDLNKILNELKNNGWRIIIISWLSKNTTANYDKEVRTAKRNWLKKYEFPADEIHLVKYGTTKANTVRKIDYGILVDDNDKIRQGWTKGKTINPTTENLIEILKNLS